MKKNKIFALLLVSVIFISCEKEDVAIQQTSKVEKNNILTFKNVEEFKETLVKVNSMSETERKTWETEQGFKSFGTICDEFYKTIKPESFQNKEEAQSFIQKNSDKLILIERDGELYCEPKEYDNPERYLINEEGKYKIGDSVYFSSKQGIIITKMISDKNNQNTHQRVSNSIVKDYQFVSTNLTKYKMVIDISTYNLQKNANTYLARQVQIKNYTKVLWFWLDVSTTTYTIKVKGTDISWENWFLDGPEEKEDITSSIVFYQELFCAGGTVDTQPKLTWAFANASNEKGCKIENKSITF